MFLAGRPRSPTGFNSLGLRQLLLLGCAPFLALLLSVPAGEAGQGFSFLVWLAFGLALAAEGYGRALFYAARGAGRIER